MFFKCCCSLLVCAITVLASRTTLADFALFSNYEFNGTLSDSLNNSADLSAIGSPTLAGGILSFSEPDGLSLTSTLTSDDYRIEFDVILTQLGRYNKLIDFKNGALDEGLYVGPGDNLLFYDALGAGSSLLQENVSYTVALEKIGDSVRAFLNGVEQFSFTGSDPATAATDTFVLFADDSITTGEGAVGSVDAVRLYVTVVPEPSSFALLAVVSGFVAIRARKRNSRMN